MVTVLQISVNQFYSVCYDTLWYQGRKKMKKSLFFFEQLLLLAIYCLIFASSDPLEIMLRFLDHIAPLKYTFKRDFEGSIFFATR